MFSFLAVASAAAPPPDEPMPGDYRIDSRGRVDRGTYNGWRVFHSGCHTCHGVDATGTDVAPNLLERIPTMTPRDFASKVLTSYRLVSPALEGSAEDRARERAAQLEEVMRRERAAGRGRLLMPAWESDPAVPPHVLDLYAYLSARASGELKGGVPKVVPSRKNNKKR